MSEEKLISVVNKAVVRLGNVGIEAPRLNVRFLVAHALGIPPAKAFKTPELILNEDEIPLIESLIERRARRETYSRIIGKSEFCGLWFGLNEATLEPRIDSESIVRAVVKKKKHWFWRLRKPQPLRLLDLGTGTGCLLLSLLRALPYATGIGTDIAPRAIDQARKNAKELKLDARSEFITANWDEGLIEKFDVVVCNPPYIPSSEIPSLMPAVRDHDPHSALDGGEDGLDTYRFLIPRLPRRLKEGGVVILEIGFGQAKTIRGMLEQAGLSDIKTYKDILGVDRSIEARWNEIKS